MVKTKDGNTQYNTKWIFNSSLKLSSKIGIDDNIPDGYKPGRVINWNSYFKHKKIKLLEKNRKRNLFLKNAQFFKRKFVEYIESDCISVNEFVNRGFYDKSVVHLTQSWLMYVDEYSSKSKQGKSFKQV